MKLLHIVPLAFMLAVGASACGKAKEKSAGEKLVDEMEANATAFCKCAKEDAKCIETASTTGEANETKFEKEFPDKAKIPADLQKRLTSIEAKVVACAAGEVPVDGNGSASGTGTAAVMTLTADQEKLLVDLAAVKDKVCACTDQACVEKTITEGGALDERLNTMYADESKVPMEVKVKVDAIQKGVEECAAKIGGGAPVTQLSDASKAVLTEFDALMEEVCKCADRACANAAMEKGDGLENKLKATFEPSGNIPEEAMSRLEAIETGAKDCVEKLAN